MNANAALDTNATIAGMEKIRLSQAVIVEGKHDKIRLETVVDALILTTDGFRIYNNAEQRALFRSLARSRGLVVLTDSDAAGFRLRGYIAGMVPAEKLTHVYIPDVFGKEKRKRTPSAEGKLGVEGMDAATLREALRRAGVLDQAAPPPADPITRLDFYENGLSGGGHSAQKRRLLFERLGLPRRMNTTAALQVVNHMLTRQEYQALVASLFYGDRNK